MESEIHSQARDGFTKASATYERGRPSYPADALQFLRDVLNLGPGRKVADVGAGTGKFTRLLAATGSDVIAIEPVEGMREMFAQNSPGLKVLNGTAEQLPFQNGEIDALTVAQAFHWFRGPEALSEFSRVLKPGSRIALVWNVRDESTEWVREMTRLIEPHEGCTPRYYKMEWKKAFADNAQWTPLQNRQFDFVQSGSVETILDRVSSISFISTLPETVGSQVLQQVRELLYSHPQTCDAGMINLPYRTEVYWCEKR